jgi:hypothetical protein
MRRATGDLTLRAVFMPQLMLRGRERANPGLSAHVNLHLFPSRPSLPPLPCAPTAEENPRVSVWPSVYIIGQAACGTEQRAPKLSLRYCEQKLKQGNLNDETCDSRKRAAIDSYVAQAALEDIAPRIGAQPSTCRRARQTCRRVHTCDGPQSHAVEIENIGPTGICYRDVVPGRIWADTIS